MKEPSAYFQAPLSESTSDAAIVRLAQHFADVNVVNDLLPFVDEVRAREAEQPTFMGYGLALPHARTDRASELALSVGTHPEGVPWGANGDLVRLVVLVAVPPSAIAPYLNLVRSISRLVRDPDRIEAVVRATDAAMLKAAWLAGMKP